MVGYAKIVEQVIISQVLNNAFPVTKKSKARLGLVALSGVLLCFSLGFLIFGAYLWLDANYPTYVAATAMGVMALLLAIISIIGASFFSYFQKLKIKKIKSEMTHKFIETANIVGQELGYPIQENPKLSLAVSSLAGMIAGKYVS